jgi:hypothetical protein
MRAAEYSIGVHRRVIVITPVLHAHIMQDNAGTEQIHRLLFMPHSARDGEYVKPQHQNSERALNIFPNSLLAGSKML